MILPIGAIEADRNSEYAWILAQLRRYGIAPTGDKSVDKSKLKKAQAKAAAAEQSANKSIK